MGVLEEVLAGGELDFTDMVEGGKETGGGGEIVGFAGEGGILGQLCKGDVDLVELGMAEDDTVKALLPEPEGLSLMEAFGCGGKIAAEEAERTVWTALVSARTASEAQMQKARRTASRSVAKRVCFMLHPPGWRDRVCRRAHR